MTTITNLPEELIDTILGYNDITIEDIINFRCVCKKFQHVVKHNKFMEKKFFQRWPTARKLYNKKLKQNEQEASETNKQKNKESLNFIEIGINWVRRLQNSMPQKIQEYYERGILMENSTHYTYMFKLDKDMSHRFSMNRDDIKISFYIDEIKNLLPEFSRKTVYDLTEKYYYVQLFNCLRNYMWETKLIKFEKQPHKVQLLERIATFVAQDIQRQKEVFFSSITAILDSMALEVLNSLREKYPDHSIFSTSAENFSYWEKNNIDDNHWNEAEGTQIMNTLEEHIFGKLNFRPNKVENIDWNTQLKYKCIDNVLEHKYGQEIIIYIIYHSVARRLGLRCDIIKGYPGKRICLFWKPTYVTNSSTNVRCFRINFEKFPDCFTTYHFKKLEIIEAKKMLDILSNMIQYNENLWKVNDTDLSHYDDFNWNMNLRDWSTNLEKIGPHCIFILNISKFKMLNARSDDVKFAVGMIVTHGDQSADCSTGVIIGWHRYKDRKFVEISVEDRRDGSQDFPLKICSDIKEQTHYIILTENNEMCYVGEDAVTLTTPKWIENSEIGRYFNKFEGTHYVPNKALEKCYPHDAAVTAAVTTKKKNRFLIRGSRRSERLRTKRITKRINCNNTRVRKKNAFYCTL
ncbi:F-box only protein 21-like [Anoplolepis gracilipes]|uniref:F-box only protein 21-like n=1 Tax=Anoplolepis gracilipes TaxID=354296 RepID=UPI003B9E2E1C